MHKNLFHPTFFSLGALFFYGEFVFLRDAVATVDSNTLVGVLLRVVSKIWKMRHIIENRSWKLGEKISGRKNMKILEQSLLRNPRNHKVAIGG